MLKTTPKRTTSNINGVSKRKPTGFVFENERFSVNQWNEVLLTLCNYLYDKYEKEFAVVLDMRGSKRKYFSTSKSGMDIPMQISNSNYFVETKWNAEATINFCRDIIEKFGYERSELIIEYR